MKQYVNVYLLNFLWLPTAIIHTLSIDMFYYDYLHALHSFYSFFPRLYDFSDFIFRNYMSIFSTRRFHPLLLIFLWWSQFSLLNIYIYIYVLSRYILSILKISRLRSSRLQLRVNSILVGKLRRDLRSDPLSSRFLKIFACRDFFVAFTSDTIIDFIAMIPAPIDIGSSTSVLEILNENTLNPKSES